MNNQSLHAVGLVGNWNAAWGAFVSRSLARLARETDGFGPGLPGLHNRVQLHAVAVRYSLG